jgi:hypothetical protein
MQPVYAAFGLSESEIELIAASTMKRDYFYTSPLGKRLFRLDLSTVTLGLIAGTNHKKLDSITAGKEAGISFCASILESKRIPYRGLLGQDAPHEPVPKAAASHTAITTTAAAAAGSALVKRTVVSANETHGGQTQTGSATQADCKAAQILAALGAAQAKLHPGRSARQVAQKFTISRATVYQARKILDTATPDIIEEVRRGRLSIKAAYRCLDKTPEVKQAAGE